MVIQKVAKLRKCPRSGFMEFRDGLGQNYFMETSCKTWRCVVCRPKLKNLVMLKMEYGLLSMSSIGRSYLITVTLKKGNEESKDAAYVRQAWERLLKYLKLNRPSNRTMMWFKVTEMTNNLQPHLHLLVGGIGNRPDWCHGPLDKTCGDCVQCEWRLWWLYVTGDSFIVDVREIYDVRGACEYLGKYLIKAFSLRDELEALGFKRRYSTSRNWPRAEDMRFRGSIRGWLSNEFFYNSVNSEALRRRAVQDSRRYMMQLISSDELRTRLSDREKRKGKLSRIVRLQSVVSGV